MTEKEPNSGAQVRAGKTHMRLIGCLDDRDRIEDVEDAARHHHIGVALELFDPRHLRIYAVWQEVS